MTDYKLTIEGDATLEHNAVPDDCHMNFYTVKWSDEARPSGTGRATVKMVHPDFPDAPHLFELTLGGFHLRARTDQWMGDQIGSPADLLWAQEFLRQEALHAALNGRR